ncbi:uncharacterized protein LOC135839099 [Planococcus citri]|uniref:uncharacterized protein LOC135839099 n=1 Tax=Planococcus citri TaxID=170843 RepID=UPI0031F8717F
MSELGEDLEKLKREKRCLLHSMRSDKATIISLLEQTVSNDVINAIWANLESWSSCIETLQKVDDALMEFIDYSKGNGDKEEEKILKDYNDFRKDLILYKGKFKTVKDTLTPVESPRRGRASMMNSTFFKAQLTNPVIRLQDIPVPDFDGTIESYPDWFAEFENIVDKNEDLNDFQKMYLLRRCLTGKAKKYLIDFGTKGEYYLTAMEFIHKKFNNRRRIIAEHFHQLYHLPVMKSSNMRDTLDDVQRIIRGLNVCGIQTQAFSPFITYIVSLKIPEKLRIEWESSQHDFSCYPPFETMYSFLIDKCFAYETGPNRDKEKDSSNESKVATGSSVKGKQSGSKPSSVPEKKSFAGTKGQGPPPKTSSSPPSSFPPIVCVGCGEQHYLDMCKSFLNKSINDRFDFVKSNRLCLRCLKTGHNVAMCNRNIKCNLCSGNHHRLLHRETVRSNVRNEGAGMDGSGNGTSTGNASGSTGSANSGTSGQSNSGSTATSSLGSVCALGSSKSVFLATAVVKVQGVNCTEMGRIFLDQGSEMTLITREFCERAKLKMERSESPTMLVGITNDTVQLNYCVSCVLRSRYSNFSIAIKAEVVEKIPYAVNKSNVKSVIEGFSLQFGESTDLPYSSVDILLGSEYAEFVLKDKRHFVDGLVFRESYFGYVISGSAERCSFFGQKLSFCGMSNLELSEQFRKFVEVEEIPDPKKEKIVEHELIDKHFESTYSIDQETGKFVVRLPLKESVKVLNGSFGKVCAMLKKSEIRRSDVVQKAYETIFDEYLSLKHMTKLSGEPDLKAYYMPHHVVSKGEDSHRIVFNASFTDNSGTSLNSHFLVGPKVQPDLARIVFRFNFNDEIEVFELNTLANGIGPASYIAPKCLEKVASFIKDSDKMVSDIIMRDFYMDNLATGTDSVEGAIVISRRVHEVLMKYGFPLRKYQSNSPEFLAKISSELIDTVKVCNGKKFVTLLGLLWYLDLDEIGVDIREEVLPSIVTKRVMLSIISKTFDILGILTPVMIRAKLLLQDLWKEGRLWDEEISVELKEEFAQFLSDLLLLRSYSIPRCYFRNCAIVKVQLIGYCDASVRAACAVVYVRSIDPEGIIRVNFVCSKSRLAPPKGAVIHRMELIAAVLLAKLIKFVVLSWIKIDPVKLKQFVSNRVSVIKSLVDKSRWFYVEGLKNPADLGTRGITASKFLSSEFSIVAWWIRYVRILRERCSRRKLGVWNKSLPSNDVERKEAMKKLDRLTNEERDAAYTQIIRVTQYAGFMQEQESLLKGKPVEKKSALNVLNCSKFSKFLHENRIEWKTIAPRSPHQGGIWEAAVKAGKASLYRAIGNQRLTLLELHTVSTKVEAILNARPLAYRRNNSFVEPITPGHFLIGSAIIVNSFWNTWKHDYFNQLRNRTKWKGEIRNLRVGEVVIVSVKNQSYFSWPLAIIEEVFPDDRGLVRNVNIRLADGEIRRSSVQNLVALPIENKE